MKKQRWTCIDILKCLAALAVVEIHKPLKVQSGAELLILCRFAVPVFFMITGFFYSETVAHRRELKQIGKILTITIGANLFYLIWKVLLALEDENNIDNEQEENSEEAFKETRCENSFDDVDVYRECFPDEEKDEQLYKKPVIFCLVDGRECELLYKRKASDGIVCVKFEDGSEQEVIAETVQLNRICES